MRTRKWVLLALASVLVLSGTSAAGGPADKATGSVTTVANKAGVYFAVVFDAHEGKDGRPAKGDFALTKYDADDTVQWLQEYEVKYVRVEGDVAYFGAMRRDGSRRGHWYCIYVLDGGTPGRKGDRVSWQRPDDLGTDAHALYDAWVSDWVANATATGGRRIVAGNLVVHTH